MRDKILVSGVKPTGRIHIGNYFGAIKQFVEFQSKYDSFVFIADLHALTQTKDPEVLKEAVKNVAIDYLSVGLDPEKITIFRQSDIPQVTELCWIFNCITTVPYLMRAHAYKDAEAKSKEVNVGTFDYPVLMAADILIHDADIVPVGKDQKQHVEYARDIAEKFNSIYGEIFTLPKELIQEGVQSVIGTDGRKMSKSYNNTIGLFADEDTIKKAVMSIPTDSKGIDEKKDPKECNIFALHKLFTPEEELKGLEERYIKGGIGYKESKDILIKNMNAYLEGFREKRREYENDPDKVFKILEEGKEKIYGKVEEKMGEIRRSIGLTK